MDKINPFSDFLQQSVPPILVGRDQIIRTLFRDLGNKQLRAYEIAVASHVGSSALLQFLAHKERLFSQKKGILPKNLNADNYCPIYLDGANADEEVPIANWLLEEALESPIIQKFSQGLGLKFGDKPIRDLTHLLRKSRKEGGLIIFLIDRFDDRFSAMATDESIPLRGLSNYTSFIITSKKPLAKLNQTAYASWFGSITHRLDLEPISSQEKRTLISYCLNQIPKMSSRDLQMLTSKYSAGSEIAGMHPLFILSACSELMQLKGNLSGIDEHILEGVLKDRLAAMFQSHFSHYLRHLDDDERESLANLVFNQVNPKDYSRLIDLQRAGLLIKKESLGTDQFAPFSTLFQNYLEIECSAGSETIIIKGDYSPLHRQILKLFIQTPNQVITYAELIKKIWQKENVTDKNLRLLRETIRNLKKSMNGKMDGEILNHRKVGYELRI
ncbi:MAG: helix-turn-helix domain-containing protein [Anaerolineae bacterium]